MKNLFGILSLVLLIVLSSNVFADQEWSSKVKVGEINAGYKEGFVVFSVLGTLHNPKNCSANMYSVNIGSADVNSVLLLLLSAQTRAADIQVAVDTTKCGQYGHAIVTRIKLLPL